MSPYLFLYFSKIEVKPLKFGFQYQVRNKVDWIEPYFHEIECIGLHMIVFTYGPDQTILGAYGLTLIILVSVKNWWSKHYCQVQIRFQPQPGWVDYLPIFLAIHLFTQKSKTKA